MWILSYLHNYHCCHGRQMSMSAVTHYDMAYSKCVFTHNLSLLIPFISAFYTAWTSRVIKLSADKFLSIKKANEGDTDVISNWLGFKTPQCLGRRLQMRLWGPGTSPCYLPAPRLVGFTDSDVLELNRQGHSQWSGPLAFECRTWIWVASITDLFATV